MTTPVEVAVTLAQLGGVSTSADLRALTSRRALRAAVAQGVVRRLGRGTVALPALDPTQTTVRAVQGARSHLSAALDHGWAIAVPPTRPMVTVPRSGQVSAADRARVRIFWGTLTDLEVANGVTGPARTVVDCARTLGFGQALAVADSALRSGGLTRNELVAAARASPRTGRSRAVRVAESADPRAANPFESMLRGIALDVPGLSVEPQVHIGGAEFIGAADLVDVRLGIVIEAESWAYHGDRSPFDRDVRRYTAMVRAGWRVVRFLWADVYRDPAAVHAVLTDLVGETHPATQTA
ncbi:hypothetical protein [Nocardioides cynanchi]|uniref:hypothetical protein n=1 Tax=Nocardioides cynanchi TaxID=2558918 RepID=UPI0012470FD6|nr:hypothetical protein [Nocardioides cynanchi]